jgi:hypothetical protein
MVSQSRKAEADSQRVWCLETDAMKTSAAVMVAKAVTATGTKSTWMPGQCLDLQLPANQQVSSRVSSDVAHPEVSDDGIESYRDEKPL